MKLFKSPKIREMYFKESICHLNKYIKYSFYYVINRAYTIPIMKLFPI